MTAPASICKLGVFSVLYFNARSLLPKLDELRAAILIHKPDIICIVETWLDESISDNEVGIQNYDIVRLDRNRHGGGILIYVNSSFSHSLVFSGPNDLELIVLSVNNSQCKVAISLFYRPPSSPYSVLDKLLISLCSHVAVTLFSNFILLGDFNVNVLNSLHPLFSKLQSVASSLCLTQVVTEPTHVVSNACSLIDLIFLSSPSNLISCVTI